MVRGYFIKVGDTVFGIGEYSCFTGKYGEVMKIAEKGFYFLVRWKETYGENELWIRHDKLKKVNKNIKVF